MAKYELKLKFWSDGTHFFMQSEDGRIECRKIEWKTKEPTRVADYLVEARPTRLVPYYVKETHPIGQQPKGSVMVPGSEREDCGS